MGRTFVTFLLLFTALFSQAQVDLSVYHGSYTLEELYDEDVTTTVTIDKKIFKMLGDVENFIMEYEIIDQEVIDDYSMLYRLNLYKSEYGPIPVSLGFYKGDLEYLEMDHPEIGIRVYYMIED